MKVGSGKGRAGDTLIRGGGGAVLMTPRDFDGSITGRRVFITQGNFQGKKEGDGQW